MNIYALCISSRGCIRFKDFFLIGCFAKYPFLLIQYILSIQSRRNMLAVLYLVMLNGKINTRFKRLMTWFLNYKHSFFSSKDGHSWSIISTGIENGDLIWSFHISIAGILIFPHQLGMFGYCESRLNKKITVNTFLIAVFWVKALVTKQYIYSNVIYICAIHIWIYYIACSKLLAFAEGAESGEECGYEKRWLSLSVFWVFKK